jgi:hypothetical protein
MTAGLRWHASRGLRRAPVTTRVPDIMLPAAALVADHLLA